MLEGDPVLITGVDFDVLDSDPFSALGPLGRICIDATLCGTKDLTPGTCSIRLQIDGVDIPDVGTAVDLLANETGTLSISGLRVDLGDDLPHTISLIATVSAGNWVCSPGATPPQSAVLRLMDTGA